jgi:VWFA-related protein
MRPLALILVSASLCPAQQPVFRAGTRLVDVSVTVLDHKGAGVQGLDPANFTILDGGKTRPVAFFRFEGAPDVAAPQTARLPRGIFSNRVELAGGPPRNITALVLDALNTPAEQTQVVRAQLIRYLKALSPETRVAIFHMGRQLRVLYDFSDDAAALRAQVEKAVLGMPLESVTDFNRSIIEAEQFVNMFPPEMQKSVEEMMRTNLETEMMVNAAARRSRMERSLAEMEMLGRHLAGIPGRKNLIWIGAGFSMFSLTGNLGMGPRGDAESFESEVRRTSQRLAQQGITLYIVDSRGVELPAASGAQYSAPMPVRGRGRFEPQMDAENISNDPHSAMDLMANITGGRYLYNTNDLMAGFKQVAADSRGTYTLGFYSPDEPDGKWHKLKVKVNRPGVNVRHREGYLADAAPSQPAEWTSEMWAAAIRNPIGSTVIPLTASCETTPEGELALLLNIGASQLSFRPDGDKLKATVQVAVVDRLHDGRMQSHIDDMNMSLPPAQWDEAVAKGLTYRRHWKPEPDVTAIRILVRDARTGEYGTLDVAMQPTPPPGR